MENNLEVNKSQYNKETIFEQASVSKYISECSTSSADIDANLLRYVTAVDYLVK